jgi:hypothetical protein
MITKSRFVAAVASASLLLGAMDTAAAPSTVFLEGTTLSFSDYFAGSDVPGNVGQPFSVKVTFDVANGIQTSDSLPGISFSQSFAVRGCRTIVDGLCADDSGAQMPVVTDYSVAAAFAPGDLRPIPTAEYLWDLTSRFNGRTTGIDPSDTYSIERHQEQCTVVAADPETGYEERNCVATFFWVYLTTDVNTLLGSTILDLTKAPNLADVPPGQVGLTYMSSERLDVCLTAVDEAPACTTLAYGPGSINWTGTLTSAVVVSQGPKTKDECKKNGWKTFGFRNQGQCVSYVNHLP